MTVFTSEATNRLGSVVSWVLEHQNELIIENLGAAVLAIIPYSEYERTKKLQRGRVSSASD